MEAALESGWVQREIADASYRFQREVDDGERVIVGVNRHAVTEELAIPILAMDPAGETRHLERLNRVRRERDQELVRRRLEELRVAAQGPANLMDPIIEAARAYATLGEICDVLREVFGVYQELLIV
jgi:methylmalonyl-CoA mutase N-terminal domain/subunit